MSVKTTFSACAVALAILISATSAQASYIFAGSWIVGEGPVWTSNPTVYSGQEAAAFLFGGNPADYAISTVDANPANINNLTFLDGWADSQYLANPQPENFKLDLGAPGYAAPGGTGTAYSAYVLDHTCFNRYGNANAPCTGNGVQYVNYAFVKDVPEPGTMALFGLGLAGLGFVRRRNAV